MASRIELSPDTYVVAVSGGVDSVVLLHLLNESGQHKLVVAHYDHGIRRNSHQDRLFVETLAKEYKLSFSYAEGLLGPGASEAKAREKRYEFLNQAKEKYKAKAIITAHHQDDLLETAIINLLRGTGRKGLSSLNSTPDIKRPLLDLSKQEILKYAKAHHLKWREDQTNQEDKYLRNYIRLHLLPNFSSKDRQKLLTIIKQANANNQQVDQLLKHLLDKNILGNQLDRLWFVSLDHKIAREVMAAWLRQNGLPPTDKAQVERLTIGAKTLAPGKKLDINAKRLLKISQNYLALASQER